MNFWGKSELDRRCHDIMIRHNATRKLVPGTIMDIENKLWVVLICEPETEIGGFGNKLTLRKLTEPEVTLYEVMNS